MTKRIKYITLMLLLGTSIAYSEESPMKVEIYQPAINTKAKTKYKGIFKPHFKSSNDLVSIAENHVGLNARNLGVRRSNWCMDGLKVFLRKGGYKTVSGSRAIDATKLGPRTHVQPGTVAIVREPRNLHVGIIKSDNGGSITLVSANYSNRVGIGDYSKSRIVAVIQPIKNED